MTSLIESVPVDLLVVLGKAQEDLEVVDQVFEAGQGSLPLNLTLEMVRRWDREE